MPAVQCLPVPAGLSMVEAAALPETLFTCWTNLIDGGKLEAGQTVLIHGGASGIGTTGIQLAKALGATVFVTAGSAEKCAACLKLGADLAIDYKTEDFVAVVKDATGKRGVDVVLDMVGGDYVRRDIEILALGGRHVSIATQGGVEATIPIFKVMQKRLILTGSTLRPRSPAEKGVIARALLETAWPMIAARATPAADPRRISFGTGGGGPSGARRRRPCRKDRAYHRISARKVKKLLEKTPLRRQMWHSSRQIRA